MNEQTFLFYDLETTGLKSRSGRIMQFAAQRTSLNLELIGDPFNIIVSLTDEILPDPYAILTTGITPQQTIRNGVTEAAFAKIVSEQAFTPNTIAIGYNTIRFDDEFMRNCFYRNFYDPYEYSWKDGRSRWDLLDVVRMTRALRPDGILWPVSEDGKAVNKLELITKLNGIVHEHAHDALSDVIASIEVAKLLRSKQPDLFAYLFKIKDKKEVQKLVDPQKFEPFVYSTGKLGSGFDFTSVFVPISTPDSMGRIAVYNLRYDPNDYNGMEVAELRSSIYAKADERKADDFKPFPAKILAYNKCPAVAPLGVLRHEDQERIQLDIETITRHLQALKESKIKDVIAEALGNENDFPPYTDVDEAIYDGFFGPSDKSIIEQIRSASTIEIGSMTPSFSDPRLAELFFRYKARNMPEVLSSDEAKTWDKYRLKRLEKDLPDFAQKLEKLAVNASPRDLMILEDLQLWAHSIMPTAD